MSLDAAVREAARSTPDAVAVRDPDGPVTYAELDHRSQALAEELAARGVGRGDRVVLWAPKSADLVAATQAVLRAGAVYVPVHGDAPPARVRALAGDCSAKAAVASDDRIAALSGLPVPAGVLPLSLARGPVHGTDAPGGAADGDPAYILYTSGSTGRPKGVTVSHGAALAFVAWAAAEVDARPDDVFANHASFGFDLSVLDLYAAFHSGASVLLVAEAAAHDPHALVDLLYRERISVWYSVPSVLMAMMRRGGLTGRPAPERLRAILFAGEPFPIQYVRELAAWTDARLLNLYGPTETNVCAFHEVRVSDLERDRPAPIGRAACGDLLEVLHEDGAAAGPGEVGELVVGGPTLMRGYWGRPPLDGPHRTGDLVRVLPDGLLEYVGRRDSMLKVRGHRVEPHEVEAVLEGHPGVDRAAVVCAGSGLDAVLTAFLVPARGGAGALSVRRHVVERLPPGMVPDLIRFVDELPRNANGKIDRAGLTAAAAQMMNGDPP
ncbi:amino acid adenylation domain-containing protein [Nocardiopsis changdeensis]|uniref:amino acid adenylation domain-containing protein n=1 Tax=Nocardiopsis changdeensis TaxID=2831969 RepID=UPI003F4854C9